jgi:hypothetical protein
MTVISILNYPNCDTSNLVTMGSKRSFTLALTGGEYVVLHNCDAAFKATLIAQPVFVRGSPPNAIAFPALMSICFGGH